MQVPITVELRDVRLVFLAKRGDRAGMAVTDARDAAPGPTVQWVAEGSPGDRAGIQVGDILVALAGQAVRSAQDYRHLLDALPAGKATYTLHRGAAIVSAVVNLGPKQ